MDLEKAYEVAGTFQADVSAPLLPESDGFDFSISGSIEGIQHETSIDMIMSMAINIDKSRLSRIPRSLREIYPFEFTPTKSAS